MAASTSSATVTAEVLACVAGTDIVLGALEVEVRLVNGKVKAPTTRELKRAVRRGLR